MDSCRQVGAGIGHQVAAQPKARGLPQPRVEQFRVRAGRRGRFRRGSQGSYQCTRQYRQQHRIAGLQLGVGNPDLHGGIVFREPCGPADVSGVQHDVGCQQRREPAGIIRRIREIRRAALYGPAAVVHHPPAGETAVPAAPKRRVGAQGAQQCQPGPQAVKDAYAGIAAGHPHMDVRAVDVLFMGHGAGQRTHLPVPQGGVQGSGGIRHGRRRTGGGSSDPRSCGRCGKPGAEVQQGGQGLLPGSADPAGTLHLGVQQLGGTVEAAFNRRDQRPCGPLGADRQAGRGVQQKKLFFDAKGEDHVCVLPAPATPDHLSLCTASPSL